jgi:signal peptidase I
MAVLARRTYHIAYDAAVIFSVIIIAFNLGNYAHLCFPVNGISMEPAIWNGDLAVVEPVGISSVRVGDMVVYHAGGIDIIHRVVAVQNVEGTVALTVKGDNNPRPDGGLVTSFSLVGKVVLIIKYLGFPMDLPSPYNYVLPLILVCLLAADYLMGREKHATDPA